jgi:hypothetical protein
MEKVEFVGFELEQKESEWNRGSKSSIKSFSFVKVSFALKISHLGELGKAFPSIILRHRFRGVGDCFEVIMIKFWF